MRFETLIIGGGVSGIMAQYVFPDSMILDAKSVENANDMTASYGANYLWEPIECFESKEVLVMTSVDGRPPEFQSIKRYKNKIGKGHENAEDWNEQFRMLQKGHIIVKPNFEIKALYSSSVTHVDLDRRLVEVRTGRERRRIYYDTLISTIPMDILVSLSRLNYRFPVDTVFKCNPIYVRRTKTRDLTYVFRVDYISDPTNPVYRSSRYLDTVQEESLIPFVGGSNVLRPGKIYDSNATELIREHFYSNGVVCVGRYGKWVSDELIHQTFHTLKALKEVIG